jgi:hypothetical protein
MSLSKKQNEQHLSQCVLHKALVFFSLRKPKEVTLAFEEEVLTKYLAQILLEKGQLKRAFCFLLWHYKIVFSFFSQMFNLTTSLKVLTEF